MSSMEIDFNPNIRLQSTFYHVSGYDSDLLLFLPSLAPIPYPKYVMRSNGKSYFNRKRTMSDLLWCSFMVWWLLAATCTILEDTLHHGFAFSYPTYLGSVVFQSNPEE